MRERHTRSHFEQIYDCVEFFGIVRSFLCLRFSLAWALQFSSKDDTPRRTSFCHETRLTKHEPLLGGADVSFAVTKFIKHYMFWQTVVVYSSDVAGPAKPTSEQQGFNTV